MGTTVFDPFGAPQYGLNDVKVATWKAAGGYEAVVDVPAAQMMGTTLQTSNAQLEGDDAIQASGSRATGAQVRIRFGSISLSALEVILGQKSLPSGSTTQRVLTIKGGHAMPYFGICGKAVAEEGEGDTHVFIPKCKVMGDVTVAQFEYGRFAIPEMTVQAVPDETYGIVKIAEHSTDTAVAIPVVEED